MDTSSNNITEVVDAHLHALGVPSIRVYSPTFLFGNQSFLVHSTMLRLGDMKEKSTFLTEGQLVAEAIADYFHEQENSARLLALHSVERHTLNLRHNIATQWAVRMAVISCTYPHEENG